MHIHETYKPHLKSLWVIEKDIGNNITDCFACLPQASLCQYLCDVHVLLTKFQGSISQIAIASWGLFLHIRLKIYDQLHGQKFQIAADDWSHNVLLADSTRLKESFQRCRHHPSRKQNKHKLDSGTLLVPPIVQQSI